MVEPTGCECSSNGTVTETTDSNRTPTSDPPVPVEDAMAMPIPEDVSTAMQRAYDLDAQPATIGEWLDGVLSAYRAAGNTVTADDMCAVDDARHEVELDDGGTVPGTDAETAAYICVLDPLAVPFLAGTAGTVRSESPVSDATIEFRVAPDGVSVDPETTVVSLGVDAPERGAEDAPADATPSVDDAYEMLCPYGHAFSDEDAYERWDAERDGVATMSLDAEAAVGVAVGIARRLAAGE